MSEGEDPFDCFGGDHEEDDDPREDAPAINSIPRPARDEEFGVLAFHRGTEQSLLNFVRNQVSVSLERTPGTVMKAVDQFCEQRHWMMHVGPDKKHQLEAFLHECVSSRTDSENEFVLLELGTYCGYSSILWASALQQQQQRRQLVTNFHVYTVEANPQFARVARKLVGLAGLAARITVLDLDLVRNQKLVDLLEAANGPARIDFLFIDHDKQAYLEDLRELERAKWIRAGVHVAADNVVFARIDDYRNYVREQSEEGIVRSRLEEASLEYSEAERRNAPDQSLYEDGIEMTVYLKDP